MTRTMKLAALLACATALSGQKAPPPDPMTIIKAQIQPITTDGQGHFSGHAWNALVADGAAAQFTMIGEQHGSGSIALLEAALQRDLARRGYTHSALEVGPDSTAFVERLIRRGPGQIQRFIGAPGHGFTIPFLFFGEEADMAEAMVRSSPDRRQALFGLDQEFVGGGPILVENLHRLARTAAERKAVATLRAASAKDPMMLGSMSEQQLAALEKGFSGNAPALKVIDAVRTSVAIYRPYMGGSGSFYDSNLARENYMKTNFVRQFTEAKRRNGKAPKVFFKFGGYHAMRGLGGTNVPALGNFLGEWGLPQGYRLVNVMIDCDGGEAMNPQTNKAGPCESYFSKDALLSRAMAGGPAVQIVNLRELRPQLDALKSADAETRKLILAFDYYIAVKGGRAARPLGTLPS
ncbi:hypothetical protein G7078_07510 [Sphingomonas sinipercae]|uniref:Erythromycin esterase family protein n=1 Tax=Sphingomonas sinipercae TaxID=2714944 RepID=A0A6G7ZP16_9SPHN|nr:hypothetical protein [Sphingomonas sinipercae]QIL02646.1 hypothetical protein G7078_07510 [Sphingomonas sinipercae]